MYTLSDNRLITNSKLFVKINFIIHNIHNLFVDWQLLFIVKKRENVPTVRIN